MALFKFKPTPIDAHPARAALRMHLAEVAKLEAARTDTAAKDTAAANAVAAEATATAAVQMLRDEIDRLHADARYDGQTADTHLQDRALAEAEQNQGHISNRARGAASVRIKYQTDMRDLTVQLNALHAQTPRLLHEALLEMMTDTVGEFEEAEVAFRAVHRRVFAMATAADQLAMRHQFGEFCGSAGYFNLRIPRPLHAAYDIGQTPDQAHAAYQEDAKAFDKGTEALVHALLNDTAED